MSKIVHGIHFPVSAKSFVVPIVERLNNHGLDTELWLENPEEHRDVVASIEVPQKIIESDLILNPIKLIQRLQSYREAIQKVHLSILHTHQSRSSLIPLLASKIEQVPVRIYHNHGLPYLGYKGLTRWLLRLLEVINISLATDVLMVSQSNLDAAIEDKLIDNKRGKVIGSGSICGIDLEKYNVHNFDDYSQFIAREKLGIDCNSFVLAYVGRPHKRKGFDRLLTAWQESKLGLQGNVLLMAGCKDADVRLRLGDDAKGIMAIGYTDDMIQFYAACDAVVLPSDHEGFPYGLLEAAAAGKALIGSDIPGISCAIKHNQTGLLVSLSDVNGLKDAILKIASNPDLRKEFGENARERVEKEFDREIVLNELLLFYSLLQSKNSPMTT
jgi:N,N'-diacetylbacillosaminyl-diphospho-undecaprenol alpha-1,3-N-acetylgalactosaminyltransferase